MKSENELKFAIGNKVRAPKFGKEKKGEVIEIETYPNLQPRYLVKLLNGRTVWYQEESLEHGLENEAPEGYMTDAVGRLVPTGLVDEIDKLRDVLIRDIVFDTLALRKQMADFKRRMMSDLYAFVELSAEKYNVKMGGSKGNITFMSFDGGCKIQIAIAENIVFDERLQIAKEIIDGCIHRWAEGSGAEIRALVEHAFQTDKEGKISVGRVLSLTRLKIDDEQWKQAMKAVHDSMQTAGTKTYVRIYKRIGDSDRYEQVSLDFSQL